MEKAKCKEEFLALRPIYERVKVKDQFEKIGVSESLFKKYSWYNSCRNKTFSQLSGEERERIIEDLFLSGKNEAQKELESLLTYLDQEGVFGKFAIVDLGWNGSMQRALGEVLDSNGIQNQMTGFFLAQRDEYYKNRAFIENYGYLFNYGDVSEKENLLLNSGTNLLELLFSADHGTTLKYEFTDKKSNPVLAEYEYADIIQRIKICQNAALDFIRSAQKSNQKEWISNEKNYFESMYHVLRDPTDDIIELFGDMNYSDLNEKEMYLAKRVRFLPVRNFMNEFRYSGWKVAFLKRNLKTKHAFYIYCVLRKLFN